MRRNYLIFTVESIQDLRKSWISIQWQSFFTGYAGHFSLHNIHKKRIEYILEWNLANPSLWIFSVPFSLKGSSKCTNLVNVHKLYAVCSHDYISISNFLNLLNKLYKMKSSFVKWKASMWNDHWSIMKPAYFIMLYSFNINLRFSIKWCSRAQKVI